MFCWTFCTDGWSLMQAEKLGYRTTKWTFESKNWVDLILIFGSKEFGNTSQVKWNTNAVQYFNLVLLCTLANTTWATFPSVAAATIGIPHCLTTKLVRE